MCACDRRQFLKISVAAASGLLAPLPSRASADDIRLGWLVGLSNDPEKVIATVHELGFPTCQVHAEDFSPELASRLRRVLDQYKVEATALVSSGPGRMVWDFDEGPLTIGLVPRATRRARVGSLKRASDFAKKCGIPALLTHCGFIPENHHEDLYKETVGAIREVVGHCKNNGQMFLYETGQETPITLLRTLQDVGLENQGVNLDTANLILYGKGNPLDALDVIGKHVRGLHAKDGFYPVDPHRLGEEVPLGQGKVDFPKIVQRLRELGYRGAITIEREISGPQQLEDVRKAKAYLEKLIV